MKFIDFLKNPIQDSPGKTEKDFPFFPNFFHFGMKPMEPKKIKDGVAHMSWVGRVEYLRKGQGEVGRDLLPEILYRHCALNQRERFENCSRLITAPRGWATAGVCNCAGFDLFLFKPFRLPSLSSNHPHHLIRRLAGAAGGAGGGVPP